ncbi:Zygote arrest protein 1 [Turnera subulata]|uniref:Zygote arrest protein 1 n=1 Tax=Turnera subulata TaxID=218843 RepID=A0A9Q0EZM2_9ROSI|nr:Zygote arrest protein 1 [Turnera subulata]
MVLGIVSLAFLLFSYSSVVSSLNDEGLALLSFKQSIDNSTVSPLDNWNPSDANPCSWHGVTCREGKVSSLNIPSMGLKGSLHPDIGKLVALRHVNLRNNYFSGSLPIQLFGAVGLNSMVLSGNSFSGPVPDEIGNLNHLQSLDLSQNFFSDSLPASLVQCNRLRILVLSHNSFTGSLPYELGSKLVMLQTLNISFNNLSGLIPSSLGNLSRLQGVLDLSHNLFNGPIPPSLGNLPETVYINLTHNNLSGTIPQNGALVNSGPTAFIGNPLLCGLPLQTHCPLDPSGPDHSPKPIVASTYDDYKPRKHRSHILIPTIAGIAAGLCLLGLGFTYWRKKVGVNESGNQAEGRKFEEKSSMRKDMFCFRTDDLESLSENVDQYTFVPLNTKINFDLEQLLKASAFLLGKSGIGIVYKVVLDKGLTLAVRRLEDGNSQRFRDFQTAVEAIGKIKHPNIVTLLAYCYCINEKLLIYDYVPNGDLATALHGRTGMTYFRPLSWSVRLQIMRGLAKGLAFLHDFSPKRYVHGNLKPSNVLLGEFMEPRISDFGLSYLACTTEEYIAVQLEQSTGGTPEQGSPYAVTPTNVRATGSYYEAPEASKAKKPSQKWDVYSFGVILLEMISGKSPIVQMSLSGMDLVQSIQLSVEVKPLSDVLDPFLVHDLDKENEMVVALRVALACVHGNPDKRPSMRYVSDALEGLPSSS